jgi:hypothetical protein
MRRTLLILVAALLCLPATASGLIGYLWTFEELKSKSDVIVIAKRGDTRETGVHTLFTELTPPYPVVELNTTFTALSVLKGTLHGTRIVLRHYRRDGTRSSGAIVNAPAELNFGEDPTAAYLLFLKRSKGVLQPTSGQVFPADSIFALPKNSITLSML